MLKQLQHNRFIKMNDELSSISCYWYVQAQRNVEPIGNTNDDDYHKRPRYILT
jgi:hypothetical protein